MYRIDDTVTPLEASTAAAEFRRVFTMLFKQAGALILGFEGGTAMACFGSPPERIFLGKAGTGLRYGNGPNDTGGVDPAKKAVRCVEGLINFLPCADWHFGIESGKCAFSRTGESGIIANGLPVTRAKMYAAVATRIKARAVVGETVKHGARTDAKKLPLRDSGSGTAFNCWVVGG
jgi:class 3 adenylate cyclase